MSSLSHCSLHNKPSTEDAQNDPHIGKNVKLALSENLLQVYQNWGTVWNIIKHCYRLKIHYRKGLLTSFLSKDLLAGVLYHDPASLLEANVTDPAVGQQGMALFSSEQP